LESALMRSEKDTKKGKGLPHFGKKKISPMTWSKKGKGPTIKGGGVWTTKGRSHESVRCSAKKKKNIALSREGRIGSQSQGTGQFSKIGLF